MASTSVVPSYAYMLWCYIEGYVYGRGSDISTNVTFNAGISTQTVTIPILNNGVVAESVLFSVVLTSADPAVVLQPETADVIVEDDDCELSSSQSVLGVQDFTS